MLKRLLISHTKRIEIILLLSLFVAFLPCAISPFAIGQPTPLAPPVVLTATLPSLSFSTFLGGSVIDVGNSLAVAVDGSYYVTGYTKSDDFPILNAYNDTLNGAEDVFIVKFAANDSLLWSTFLGGSDDDGGYGIAVASDGSCYVTGYTSSNDFPVLNAYQSTHGGGHYDTFVAKFASNSSLLWSTYLGGNNSEIGHSITVASDGSCYVTGYTSSSDFPILNAYQSTFGGLWDAFVTKFATNGSLLWSSYLGGNHGDEGFGIAAENDSSCYITGYTHSSDFPIKNAYNNTYGGLCDVFVSKFASNGSLLWSTYLGGSDNDNGCSVAVTSDDSCYVTGGTQSSDFPTLNAYQSTSSGSSDAFVTKFAANGSLLWSTYLGGNNDETGYGIAVASDGSCYVTGATQSSDFPTEKAYQDAYGGSLDVFVSEFASNGSLLWSTYLGGSDKDIGCSIVITADGSCSVTGATLSSDFPTKNAYDNTNNGDLDVFVTKIIEEEEDLTAPNIQSIQIIPAEPTELDEVTIRCSVSDDISGVDYVTLHYRVNDGSWIHDNMTNTIGSMYEADIGSFSVNDDIMFYFTAVDFNGNVATNDNDENYYSFTILSSDFTGPTIENITYSPANPTINETITVTCTVTDENGIQSVKLYYRVNEGSWETLTMILEEADTYQTSFVVPHALVNDVIEYYIEAIDNSPNHNSAVDDNDGQYYEILLQTSNTISAYNYLMLFTVLPVLSSILLKRKK